MRSSKQFDKEDKKRLFNFLYHKKGQWWSSQNFTPRINKFNETWLKIRKNLFSLSGREFVENVFMGDEFLGMVLECLNVTECLWGQVCPKSEWFHGLAQFLVGEEKQELSKML